MRVRIGGIVFFAALWCAGCASQPAAPIVAAVAPGHARISITRTDEGPSWSTAAKIEVNGPDAHPLYQFLKSEKAGLLGTQAIKWNFTKFLINRQGEVVNRYAPVTTPDRITNDLERWLE